MDGLMNILKAIGDEPLARWIALAFALRAVWSVVMWRRCPLLCGEAARLGPEAAAARRGAFDHSWRFLLVMLTGIALAVGGLFRLAQNGADAPGALLLLILGVYLFTTEPARRQIQDAESAYLAATAEGPERREVAAAILRDSHVKLVAIEVGIAALLGVAILAMGGAH
ncbi:hypothetical protein [Oceanicella actignis]|uniref:Integral membrane protein n=1 Tax=Oceanicella actignis TaxID=1189325 RepID=A0A1M7S8Q0_9RHOB|nr:hypothetical protein [Oceanicella actignis]TYO91637.1 hypothetical protein LY05_00494 [Oceanicella actignis]SET32033.1 hypothetical protein SAMN04488119_103456 [Oceanicella actignis]SHN54861.1 hypothetical protein SAMN05216200_10252 [Oceanicella actignis]